MKQKKIILAGSDQLLLAVLEKLSKCDNLSIVAVLSDSSENLPTDFHSIFLPLAECNSLITKEFQADWFFHLGSRTIFSTDFLDLFRCGAINAHPGILPTYAGLFPYQWAMRNDEMETGATLHWITEDVDSGPIALQETCKINEDDTGYSVYKKSNDACINLVKKALKMIDRDEKLSIMPQDKFKRVYYSNSDSIASEVDWNSNARKVFNFIRASDFSPLASPSYTAKTHFKLAPFPLQKVRLGGRALGIAGMVCSLKEGIHVVCGDGFTVILSPDSECPPLKVGDILG